MSSEIQSQRLLTDAGVDAEPHVRDGMWHSFFSTPKCRNQGKPMP